MDLNLDVDVRECNEGGSVFQNLGACKEKTLFCEDDERGNIRRGREMEIKRGR